MPLLRTSSKTAIRARVYSRLHVAKHCKQICVPAVQPRNIFCRRLGARNGESAAQSRPEGSYWAELAGVREGNCDGD